MTYFWTWEMTGLQPWSLKINVAVTWDELKWSQWFWSLAAQQNHLEIFKVSWCPGHTWDQLDQTLRGGTQASMSRSWEPKQWVITVVFNLIAHWNHTRNTHTHTHQRFGSHPRESDIIHLGLSQGIGVHMYSQCWEEPKWGSEMQEEGLKERGKAFIMCQVRSRYWM